MIRCSNCKVLKNESEFYGDKTDLSKKQRHCKACSGEYKKNLERLTKQNNRGQIWTEKEDRLLDEDWTSLQLAQKLGRSVRAIEARRFFLKHGHR